MVENGKLRRCSQALIGFVQRVGLLNWNQFGDREYGAEQDYEDAYQQLNDNLFPIDSKKRETWELLIFFLIWIGQFRVTSVKPAESSPFKVSYLHRAEPSCFQSKTPCQERAICLCDGEEKQGNRMVRVQTEHRHQHVVRSGYQTYSGPSNTLRG